MGPISGPFAAATAFFAAHTPAQVALNPALQAQATALALQLAAFNSGVTGPGACCDQSIRLNVAKTATPSMDRTYTWCVCVCVCVPCALDPLPQASLFGLRACARACVRACLRLPRVGSPSKSRTL